MSGFVYVLTNKSMPGLVKIGYTKKNPQERASELYGSGVPSPFAISYAVWCNDPFKVEQQLHERLRLWRGSESREFFSISETHAVIELLQLSIADRFPNIHIVRQWAYVNEDVLEEYAHSQGINPAYAGEYVTGLMQGSIDRQNSCDGGIELIESGECDDSVPAA